MPDLLDRFIPSPEVRERHEITIRAPAALVLDVARHLNWESVPVVQVIFWLRAKAMGGSKAIAAAPPKGLLADMQGIGWGLLAEEPGRLLVLGAACQPWLADVTFRPIPPEQFLTFNEPRQVKIAWTIEADSLGPALTRHSTETRVVSTDEEARTRFRRYWLGVRPGVVMIRWLLARTIRQQAERRWRAENK